MASEYSRLPNASGAIHCARADERFGRYYSLMAHEQRRRVRTAMGPKDCLVVATRDSTALVRANPKSATYTSAETSCAVCDKKSYIRD